MSAPSSHPPTEARVSLYRLARDPLGTLEAVARRSGGAVTRLRLGPLRPYLITDPDHVQRVLRERADTYVREGMLWKPLRRLEGDGIAGEGPAWTASRRLLQPVFTARHVASLLDPMAEAIDGAVHDLDRYARSGEPIDVTAQMTRIVHRALIRAFFGDQIAITDADTLGVAIARAFARLGPRMLLPFVPDQVPLPGDRAFRRAVRTVDAVVYPYVRRARATGTGPRGDILSLLASARDADGVLLDERRVRDDVVAMFVAGTETTALALTWLWAMHSEHPPVAGRIRAEVDALDADAPAADRVAGLPYTRMALQETLRLYPVGWLVPRTTAQSDVVGGVPVPAGATVLLSPYLTQRDERHWPDPTRFEPERFAAGAGERRHRFAYFPFGGGPHQCLGSHFFIVEAQLILGALLARYRPMLLAGQAVRPRASATLRPRGRLLMLLARRTGR